LNSLPAMTTKSELESKHIAELHELAAEAGVERYRMLSRAELIEKLAGAGPKQKRPPRAKNQRKPRQQREPREQPRREAEPAPAAPPAAPQTAAPAERPKRKRRRRWGRRRKGLRVHDLLLPAAPGRQAIVYAESRAGCTALLREVAAELSAASDGPEPIALLVDPTPEELADWKREAPQAEIVSAGKAHHADDAIAQARSRAAAGEDVIVLVDSLSRFAEDFAGPDEARELLDAGLGASAGKGSLTVVAALERPS
jgi:Rho termination factor, N-terminal domain